MAAEIIPTPRSAFLEDRDDIEAVHEFQRKLKAGEEELIPATMVNRILDGENKVRVWREHRDISAHNLAIKAAVAPELLSQIEVGQIEGKMDAVERIAAALGLSIDDLGCG